MEVGQEHKVPIQKNKYSHRHIYESEFNLIHSYIFRLNVTIFLCQIREIFNDWFYQV
jgi:hypothetical protein